MNNKEIGQKAIRKVMKFEKYKKRKPKIQQGKGYDIKSSGRCIEVKGCEKAVGGWRKFEPTCFKALQKESNYYIYVVEQLRTHRPKLYIIPRSGIIRFLQPRIEWQINLPVKKMRKWRTPLYNKRSGRKR